MRLDSFLAVSRIVKRRTLAHRLCQAGGVLLNGRPLKGSWQVAPGEVITVDYGNRSVTFRVEQVPPPGRKSCPEAAVILSRARIDHLGEGHDA